MLEIFMYPVSGIMKFWHLVCSLFLNGSHAWIATIVLLVLTVRGLIAPLNWQSIKQGRIGALMRPEQAAITERLRNATEVDEAVEALKDQQELKERFAHNPAIGCLPIFIILPVFLGLYRVVLRVSGTANEPVGMLTLDDVSSFRTSTVFGVPLTDFARDHHGLVLPMLVAAITFTFLNTLITLYRGFLTTQFDQKIPRRLFWFMIITIVLVPWMLWNVAWHGPIPVTIIFYWGCTYLFTLVQTLVYEAILRKRYPLPEAVHEQRRESIRRWRAKEKAPKRSKEERKENARVIAQARQALKSSNPPEEPREA
ncbi:membrane protein insertase YidC [Corynebacterium sp.]|uniref:membrane protein insertase YidC n=1 Tax=Corynebacterium sp. TaxID=1720 RepID=UPI0026DD0DD5|nr:membrane protein insertase YidC [Corynebacterium sp.]MDO5032947.1 membrane protein insertase YidC [Corynebacterium sp.]